MLIEISNRNGTLDTNQREWIERRLQFALGRFVSRIRRVSVVFSDVNGNRGGVDQQCRIRIQLLPRGEVVVEGRDQTKEAAGATTVDRAARTVARTIARTWDYRVDFGPIVDSRRLAESR